MVLRSGKEVDNKVGEKEHDKEEKPETLRVTLKLKKKITYPLLLQYLTPLSHISQGFLTLKLWMHRTVPRKISKEMTS